ncbi:flagellar protein FlaG [Achromobacter aloeverae]|uniref:Flagellar protein n=1 Tax=Achromobacter aloeverae TaxID=1750518 RepID=A0A4Q1HNE1_9BURK|nr:flagellar protein FlaG [Achromobacter aloeverae]RXN92532.1 flagellar protein [Achromobacter aloeverae]
MAVSPIGTAALPVQATVMPAQAPTPALPVDATVSVLPTGAAQKDGNTDTSTSGQGASKLPLDQALEKLNERMQAWSTQMSFSVDQDTQRVVISIKDTKTGDTIKTIPSETVLQIAKMITEFQGGAIKTSA